MAGTSGAAGSSGAVNTLWRKLWAVLLVLALVGVPMAGAVEESEAEEQAAPEVTYDPAAGSGGDPMPDSTAKAVLVMDAGSGTVLWEKNAHEVLEPASVTKIMTMLLVCEAVDAYDSGAAAVQALLNGQVDAVVIDKMPA